jgi:hypothetical protein
MRQSKNGNTLKTWVQMLALSFDVVVLISIGVDLGRGLGFYREEETPERKNTININASMRKQA